MIHTRPDHAALLRARLCDPVQLCQRLGLERGAQRQPGGVMVLCPEHRERSPSCSVTLGPDRTVRVHCFGCGFTGDALHLVAAVHRLDVRRDFRRVVEHAAQLAGLPLEGRAPAGRPARPAPVAPPRPPAAPVARPALPDDVFAAVAAALLSIGRLDGSPAVREVELYLEGRSLLDDARAEGWAGLPAPGDTASTWAQILVDVFGPEVAALSGMLRRDGLRWSFRHPQNRLVIPWRAADGAIYTIQRRRIDAGGAPGEKYVFPAGEARAPRWPYGVDRLAADRANAPPLAVVEGAFDVLALRRIAAAEGRPCEVVGLPGTDYAARFAWGSIVPAVAIAALDNDTAGEHAIRGSTRKDGTLRPGLAEMLTAAGARRVLTWSPAPAKDWTERLRS